MKTRFLYLLIASVLVTLLLSACTGGALINSWPGASAEENVVYVSYQGAVYAVNADNGTQVWRFPKDKPDPSKPFYAPPAVSENGMIVVGNYGHTLYGLNSNGDLVWQFTSENGNFVASPMIVGDTVLAPSSDDHLYAVNLADGQEQWRFKTENMLWGQPASDGEMVFLPAMDHNLYALSLSDGSEVWTQDLGSALLSGPVLAEDGTLYLGTLDGELVAINSGDGSVLWRTPTDGHIWSSPVLQDDVLYVGNIAGKVTAVSAVDGSVVWQKDAGSPVVGGGAILPDAIAFATEGGSLIAWSLEDGQQLWTQTVEGKLYSTPVVAGEKVVVPVSEGDKLLQAYNVNGQVSWPFALPE